MHKSAWIVLLLLLAGICSVTQAAESKPKGFYAGIAGGASEVDDDGLFTGLDFDDSDTAFSIHAGYKFLKYLAVEGRATNFGTFSLSNGFRTLKSDLGAISGHVVAILPLGTSGFELFGQLGLGNIDFDCSGCSDETVASAGLGARFHATPRFSISLQVDAYAWEEDGFLTTYDVTVTASQLGVQFIF